MEPTSERSDVDFNADDVNTFKSKLPQLIENVSQLQQFARSTPSSMEVVHCRTMSRLKDGRDRSKLHKRMNAQFLLQMGLVGDGPGLFHERSRAHGR